MGSWQGLISCFSSTWALREVSPRCLVREIQGGDKNFLPAETHRNHDFSRSKRNASVWLFACADRNKCSFQANGGRSEHRNLHFARGRRTFLHGLPESYPGDNILNPALPSNSVRSWELI